MDNKYYTPELEEFHPGFEFEYLYGDTWYKHNLDGGPIIHKELDQFKDDLMKIAHAVCRVKYLDEQDFIDLGFNIDKEYKDPFIGKTNRYYKVDEYGFNTGQEISFHYFQNKRLVMKLSHYGSWSDGSKEFQIEIKNKSELKKLLTQLVS